MNISLASYRNIKPFTESRRCITLRSGSSEELDRIKRFDAGEEGGDVQLPTFPTGARYRTPISASSSSSRGKRGRRTRRADIRRYGDGFELLVPFALDYHRRIVLVWLFVRQRI